MPKERLEQPPSQEILERGREIVQAIEAEVRKVVYGPELQPLIDILTLAIFTNGHILVRASIGLAKTLTCEAVAKTLGGTFNKRQFIPDMMPAEITGSTTYNQKNQEYQVQHGPLYGANIFLADEINRAPAKTQSALLAAMEEKHLTIKNEIYELEPLFLVLATRNPIEHEGTYELPEAQLDRFLAQAVIKRISRETLLRILSDKDSWRRPSQRLQRVRQVTTPEEILDIQEAMFGYVHVDDRLKDYIVRLVEATGEHPAVEVGSSPRGAINLEKAAVYAAFKEGRPYAVPEDVERYAVDILAHRIVQKKEVRFDPSSPSPAKVVREILNAVKPD